MFGGVIQMEHFYISNGVHSHFKCSVFVLQLLSFVSRKYNSVQTYP